MSCADVLHEGHLNIIKEACKRGRVIIGARADLGRPTTTARENKESFMAYLQKPEV